MLIKCTGIGLVLAAEADYQCILHLIPVDAIEAIYCINDEKRYILPFLSG